MIEEPTCAEVERAIELIDAKWTQLLFSDQARLVSVSTEVKLIIRRDFTSWISMRCMASANGEHLRWSSSGKPRRCRNHLYQLHSMLKKQKPEGGSSKKKIIRSRHPLVPKVPSLPPSVRC
jgi:hypothetical protein